MENVLINFQSLLQDPEEKSDFEKVGWVCKTVQPGSINYAFSSPVLVCMQHRQILSAIPIRLRSAAVNQALYQQRAAISWIQRKKGKKKIAKKTRSNANLFAMMR